jgi:hypothetical protein
MIGGGGDRRSDGEGLKRGKVGKNVGGIRGWRYAYVYTYRYVFLDMDLDMGWMDSVEFGGGGVPEQSSNNRSQL